MKTRKHIQITGLAALVAMAMSFGSCEKKIDFDPGDVSPYVVVMSRPENDSLMRVYVGYSRFFLDNRRFESASDAAVTITAGGVTYSGVYDPNCYASGYYYGDYYNDDYYYGGYRFAFSPSVGDTLKLSARVPGYDEVTAVTTIPQQPQVEIVDYICDTSDMYDAYFKVKFRVKSNSNREYYSLRVQFADTRYVNDTTFIWDTMAWVSRYFYLNDPILNTMSVGDAIDADDGAFNGTVLNFTSEMFSGGEHEFSLEFSMWRGENTGLKVENTPVRLSLTSLSEELYKYTTTRDGYNSDLDGLFGEPVQIFCNVNGGVGIFGGLSSRIAPMPSARIERFNHNTGYYYK